MSKRPHVFRSCGYVAPVPPVPIAPPGVTAPRRKLAARAQVQPVRPARPASDAPARVSSIIVAVVGFILLSGAVATGAAQGVWPSIAFVGAAVPLRHSLESGSPQPRRRPEWLLTGVLMIAVGVLLAVL